MSVLVVNRHRSPLEVYHTARKLREDITNFLINDFNISDASMEIWIANHKRLGRNNVDKNPHYIFRSIKENILEALQCIIKNITIANSLHPTSILEATEKHHIQSLAISYCEVLTQNLEYCSDILPVKMSTILDFVDRVEKEKVLLREWRRYAGQKSIRVQQKKQKDNI